MKKHIIDTNALISFVTDRNPAQQAKIAGLFDSAARLKIRVLCPQNVLTEFVYVMDAVYHIGKVEIRDIISDFINLPGIEVVDHVNLKTLFELWPENIPDASAKPTWDREPGNPRLAPEARNQVTALRIR